MPAETERLLPDFFATCDGKVEIVETDVSGAGTVSFLSAGPCLAFGGVKKLPHLAWVRQRHCADGAFLQFVDDEVHLHVVELKSKLTRTEWAKTKRQFEGMLLNAFAVGATIGISSFRKIVFYVAYKEEFVSPKNTTATVFLKGKLGEAVEAPISDFETELVSILSVGDAPLVKIIRGEAGNGQFVLSAA